MKNKILLSALSLVLIFTACSDSSLEPEPPTHEFSSVYVINEGNFSEANGSVTAFRPESGQAVQQLFQEVNERDLAGIIQSISAINGNLYIALNSANKIEVVDLETFESIVTIAMPTDPYAVAAAGNNSAYVTNLTKGSVSIINLETFEVQQETIPVGMNPQNILTVDELTYVANNGFGEDNTISVINNEQNEVV